MELEYLDLSTVLSPLMFMPLPFEPSKSRDAEATAEGHQQESAVETHTEDYLAQLDPLLAADPPCPASGFVQLPVPSTRLPISEPAYYQLAAHVTPSFDPAIFYFLKEAKCNGAFDGIALSELDMKALASHLTKFTDTTQLLALLRDMRRGTIVVWQELVARLHQVIIMPMQGALRQPGGLSYRRVTAASTRKLVDATKKMQKYGFHIDQAISLGRAFALRLSELADYDGQSGRLFRSRAFEDLYAALKIVEAGYAKDKLPRTTMLQEWFSVVFDLERGTDGRLIYQLEPADPTIASTPDVVIFGAQAITDRQNYESFASFQAATKDKYAVLFLFGLFPHTSSPRMNDVIELLGIHLLSCFSQEPDQSSITLNRSPDAIVPVRELSKSFTSLFQPARHFHKNELQIAIIGFIPFR